MIGQAGNPIITAAEAMSACFALSMLSRIYRVFNPALTIGSTPECDGTDGSTMALGGLVRRPAQG